MTRARGDDLQAATLYRVTGIDPNGREFVGLYGQQQTADLLRDCLNVVRIDPCVSVVHFTHTRTTTGE